MQHVLLNDLINLAVKESASDIHVVEGRVPVLRINGELTVLNKETVPSHRDMLVMLEEMVGIERKQLFEQTRELDFGYQHDDLVRLRGNVYYEQGRIAMALRQISREIRTVQDLNLPEALLQFTRLNQGFFLVVGPTGHGKSTTLAALIDTINHDRTEHIITIEDPIEYQFTPARSIIEQREVRSDTPDFHTALHGVFRQDADILMIGEMREPETMSTAVTAAETGHMVFSTLHTNTAAQTISRIIDSFEANQQNQIRVQLASSLSGIFSQRLIRRVSGGLIPAYELLINTTAVANLIRENRTHEIDTVVETSSGDGMITLNRSLANLVRAGEITLEDAFIYSNNKKSLERMI